MARKVPTEDSWERNCFLLGEMVEEAGLGALNDTDLVKAFAQVALFATDPVAFHHFINGDITKEWIGPERTVALMDGDRDLLGQETVEVK